MENKFLKKTLSVITSMAVALLFMTGIPFSKLDMSITASAVATTLDLTGFDYTVSSSNTGWNYNGSTLTILNGYELTVTNGTFTATVNNNGTIEGGTFSGTVNNDGSSKITGGTFEGAVYNYTTISGGTFNGTVTNNNNTTISGGTFNGTVKNNSGATITNVSTIFSSTSTVDNKGIISNGTFGGTVTNYNIISNGIFNGSVNNNGTINGGDFNGGVTNRGTVNGGDFSNATVSCVENHHIEKDPATCMTQAVCKFCGASYGETAPHNFVGGTCNVSGCGAVATVEYTYGGSTYYTDDFEKAVDDINNNGGGTIILRANINWPYSENVVVTQPLVLNLGGHTLDLGTSTLGFVGVEASIIGTGTIKSVYDSVVQNSGQAVYVVGGASLTVGTENGSGPTISGGANAITTSNDAANELTIYAGTFNGVCHFSSSGSYTNNIKGGTFKDEVYANYTQIDGGTFEKNINCVNGSCIVINACECEGSLKIGQENTATKYVTLNGGSFAQGIENQTADGKTTDFLGTDRYYVDENGQVIEIADADDTGYDIIAQYVIVAPVHTVTFETNDYGGEDFEKKVADGFAVKEPTEPTDPNVNFGGWYKDSALSTAWNFTNDKITSDVTIYAKWTTNQVAQVETPVITPASGTSFDDTLEVTITCATADADIYYTTDGTTPTAAGTKYTGAITLIDSKTIKAFAVKSGMTDSEVAAADYTKMEQVATPVITPASGTSFDNTLEVTITCATADADIYYTTDGTTPTATSTKYTGSITLTDSKTIKAFAVKRGMTDSGVAAADYSKNTTITPTPNPTPDPTPDSPIIIRPNTTPVFPPEDVSSEAGTTEAVDAVILDGDTNPFAAVTISFVGLIIASVAVVIRKRKKQ